MIIYFILIQVLIHIKTSHLEINKKLNEKKSFETILLPFLSWNSLKVSQITET